MSKKILLIFLVTNLALSGCGSSRENGVAAKHENEEYTEIVNTNIEKNIRIYLNYTGNGSNDELYAVIDGDKWMGPVVCGECRYIDVILSEGNHTVWVQDDVKTIDSYSRDSNIIDFSVSEEHNRLCVSAEKGIILYDLQMVANDYCDLEADIQTQENDGTNEEVVKNILITEVYEDAIKGTRQQCTNPEKAEFEAFSSEYVEIVDKNTFYVRSYVNAVDNYGNWKYMPFVAELIYNDAKTQYTFSVLFDTHEFVSQEMMTALNEIESILNGEETLKKEMEPDLNVYVAPTYLVDNIYYELSDGIMTLSGEGTLDEEDFFVYYPELHQYSKDVIGLIIDGGIEYIGEKAFSEFFNLEQVNIQEGVKYIGDDSFAMDYALKEVALPDTLTNTGIYCFTLCKSLQSIELPSNLMEISEGMFYGAGLSEISIPESVQIIRYNAFTDCNYLKKVVFPENVLIVEYNSFLNCKLLEDINVPNNTEFQTGCFNGCEKLLGIAPGHTY